MNNNERLVVSQETGEIENTMQPGDRILRAASIDYLNSVQIWRMEHFYKGNIAEIRKTLSSLSIAEKAFLFSVVSYVGYTDCCIKHDNGKIMDAKDLCELTGMGKTQLYQTIESLRQKDIIYKGKNSLGMQYFVNPWLFVKGCKVNRVLKTMFCNYKVKVLGGQSWGSVKD